MGSMHTGLEEIPNGYDRLAEFYRQRAEAGVGLIITGGIAPNEEGAAFASAAKLVNDNEVDLHRKITNVVHQHPTKICLQILHTGRYAFHPNAVSASSLQAPISPFSPKELSSDGIKKQILDFAQCAELAKKAGYDGVEIMGSEGYFINQFIALRTNQRNDEWGGCFENRIRLALEIVKAVREKTDSDFLIIFRISLLDLVENGSNWNEVLHLAKALESAGVDILNSGIGWHEARIPTIATSVPRAAFTEFTHKLKSEVSVPLIATNRINTPEIAENIIASGQADLVCLARPFLADPKFVSKAQEGKPELINTCIACNQACLDHTFELKLTSCLVNPSACHETLFITKPATVAKTIAVVGAGPAGMACAVTLSERGHSVTLYEQQSEIGGQFNLAKKIPGKEDYQETVRYFKTQIARLNVNLKLNTKVTHSELINFESVVIATGVTPRKIDLPGFDHSNVVSYVDVLNGSVEIGNRVAIIGAGGIGFDVAEFLLHKSGRDINEFQKFWGIDASGENPGGVSIPIIEEPARAISLLQRKSGKLGSTLGKTTGWIHRAELKLHKVRMLSSVTYKKFDEAGLHILIDNKPEILDVDHVVVCAGQVEYAPFFQELVDQGIHVHLIGGAKKAGELDAKTAIKEGTELALRL